MIRHAIRYAEAGRPVFPCLERDLVMPDGKTKGAKSPYTKNGFLDATTNTADIKAWWTRWPGALIGSPVHRDQMCLDFDPYHGGGRDVLWDRCPVEPPVTLMVLSGRLDGGHHLFFQRPLGPLTSTWLPGGIDLRLGGKHYTIIPPSRHPVTGQPYMWRYSNVQPAVLPPEIVALLTPEQRPANPNPNPEPNHKALAGILRTVAEAVEGTRNHILFWAACRIFEDGYPDTANQALVAASLYCGLTPTETANTLRSAARTTGKANSHG